MKTPQLLEEYFGVDKTFLERHEKAQSVQRKYKQMERKKKKLNGSMKKVVGRPEYWVQWKQYEQLLKQQIDLIQPTKK